jgi:hypothetical protein
MSLATWWRPRRSAWWMGLLFGVGSLLFLVPAVASLGASADWIAVAFAAGSVFFTAAATLQLVVALEVPHRLRPAHVHALRPRAWMPARVDVLAAAIQWPGTLFFNVNTFVALNHALTTRETDVRVWTPDMIGSACFLIASLLAFANVEHRWVSLRPRDVDWWIAAVNLAGSIAFGVSAISAFVRPETGTELNDRISALGTAIGALGFLIGALLLPVQAERQERTAAPGSETP